MQHLRDIRDDNDKPVARHFNSPGHHGTEDVEVAVISILAGSEHQRRATETHLIRTLGTYPDGMNEKIDTVWPMLTFILSLLHLEVYKSISLTTSGFIN